MKLNTQDTIQIFVVFVAKQNLNLGDWDVITWDTRKKSFLVVIFVNIRVHLLMTSGNIWGNTRVRSHFNAVFAHIKRPTVKDCEVTQKPTYMSIQNTYYVRTVPRSLSKSKYLKNTWKSTTKWESTLIPSNHWQLVIYVKEISISLNLRNTYPKNTMLLPLRNSLRKLLKHRQMQKSSLKLIMIEKKTIIVNEKKYMQSISEVPHQFHDLSFLLRNFELSISCKILIYLSPYNKSILSKS